MKKGLLIFAITSIIAINLSPVASAFSKDISISDSQVRFSTTNFLEGKDIRIYASITNNSTSDLLGIVKFLDNGTQVNGDQPISLIGGKTDDVFVDWIPGYGSHTIKITVTPYDKTEDDPSNNSTTKAVFIQQDTDHDGITNDKDTDDDGDGVLDESDKYPLDKSESADTDGDNIGDNKDTDDDNDGVLDALDGLPLDPTETLDTDKDGIGNTKDLDDDGDGILDTEEANTKTDPLNSDTDGDKALDGADAFPTDASDSLDTDKDNIGNSKDTDDDDDGTPDTSDQFPLNKAPVIGLDDDKYTASLNNRTSFDASDSYDDDGQIISYEWVIDGKYLKEGQVITHKFITLGNHSLKLTIKDDKDQTVSKNFMVSVINIRLYTQIIVILMIALLAGILAYKYLLPVKKKKK